MSKKSDNTSEPLDKNLNDAEASNSKRDARAKELEQRLMRLEKRIKNNERFSRTLCACLDTQVTAGDAVVNVMRRSLREDVVVHEELMSAIREYDKHKVRRWFSGFLSVLLWVVSVMLAACVGAFIYWVFSGK